MKHFAEALFVTAGLGLLVSVALGQSKAAHRTYVADIAPIVQAYCLPCHLAESENPSGLNLDTYETLMKGGEKGKPIVPGKPDESILYMKLKANPPFGKQMPRGKKKMTEEQISLIRKWIEEGASKE